MTHVDEDERHSARLAARLSREAIDVPPSSLYAECAGYAKEVDFEEHLLRHALLYSDDFIRPMPDQVANDKAKRAWDFAMHHKTIGELAVARSYALLGDDGRRAFHERKALTAYQRLFWHSDAALAFAESQRARAMHARDRTAPQ